MNKRAERQSVSFFGDWNWNRSSDYQVSSQGSKKSNRKSAAEEFAIVKTLSARAIEKGGSALAKQHYSESNFQNIPQDSKPLMAAIDNFINARGSAQELRNLAKKYFDYAYEEHELKRAGICIRLAYANHHRMSQRPLWRQSIKRFLSRY